MPDSAPGTMKAMRLRLCATALAFVAWPAIACDKPFSVFQNGPHAITRLRLQQANGSPPLTAKERALLAAYEADEEMFWKLKVKTDPVCTTVPDPHNCVSECKNRPPATVQAARYREGNLLFATPAKERARLEKQEAALETRWNKMPLFDANALPRSPVSRPR